MTKRYHFSLVISLWVMILHAASANAGEKFFEIRIDRFFGSPIHVVNHEYTISGEIAYIGYGSLQSLHANWQVNDLQVQSAFIENIDVNPYNPYRFELEQKWLPEQEGDYSFKLWFTGLNGEDASEPASDTLLIDLEVYPWLPERQLALLESFSSINCGGCALVTPVLRKIVDQRPEELAMIYYHPMWLENSPLYVFNPKDQDVRRIFYEVYYTPYSIVGNLYAGGSEGIDNYLMTREYQKWAGFTLEGTWSVIDNELSIAVESESFLDHQGKDLRLMVVAIEQEVSFEEAPGNNGEKDFYHVMRFFAPDAQGTILAGNEASNSFMFDYIREVPVGVDLEKLSFLAFVQDMNNAEIYQAVKLTYKEEEVDPTWVDNLRAQPKPYHVYPNPARDMMHVKPMDGKDYTISLYNSAGVRVIAPKTTTSFSVKDLSAGFYLLVLEVDDHVYREKVSIVR